MVNLKHFLLKIIILFVAASLAIVVFVIFSINSSVSSDTKTVVFTVDSGDDVRKIAENLYNLNLIKNKTLFYEYVKFSKRDENIIAGIKHLSSSMSIVDIVDVLVIDEPVTQVSFTIQEGLTVEQIDDKLFREGFINAGDFEKSVISFNDYDDFPFIDKKTVSSLVYPLEGYLYPDTYFLLKDSFNSDKFVLLLLNTFRKKVVDSGDFGKCPNGFTFNDCIIMASIIEKEVFGDEDRRIVSGIFWKRLLNNWTLGADATLLYMSSDNVITASEISQNSGYNTRKNLGLPAGPICNPSLSAISSAFNPVDSDFWFYLTTLDTGKVIYSKTNDEHNLNRSRYL